MKDMVMQETAALKPYKLAPIREALLAAQEILRCTQKRLLQFLYSSDLSNNFIPFYDPNVNVVTDSYLSTILKVPNYDRSLAGVWCLTPHIRNQPLHPLSWSESKSSLIKDGHPYVITQNTGCFWKLIPHGKYLFTVQNTYKCPNHNHCGKYLNSDSTGSNRKNRETIEQYPDVWEIFGTQQRRFQ